MVRLSVIVLGLLLAAAWCSTGAVFFDSSRVSARQIASGGKVTHEMMKCDGGRVLYIGKCRKRPCSQPYLGWYSVKCISLGQSKYMKKTCNKKNSCKIKVPLEKGPYQCYYRCIKKA